MNFGSMTCHMTIICSLVPEITQRTLDDRFLAYGDYKIECMVTTNPSLIRFVVWPY